MFKAVCFGLALCCHGMYSTNTTDLTINDLAPPLHTSTSDSISHYPDPIKQYFLKKFQPAFFEQRCRGRDRPLIQPVYYWPGDTIRLKCVVCKESKVFRGTVKHWAVIRRKIAMHVEDLRWSGGSEEWTELTGDVGAMFEDDKVNGPPHFWKDFKPTSGFPTARVFQKDGYLIITNSRISHYGLYRCFDRESERFVEFAYYLIPYTPLLEDSMEVANGNCIGGTDRVVHLDSKHQWRMMPMFLQNQKEGVCAGECKSEYLDESHWATPTLVRAMNDPQHLATGALNLEVFLHWDRWTNCSVDGYRTRLGQCHIRKHVKDRLYRDSDIESQPLSQSHFLTRLHHLLEYVDEFERNGIPVYSGVMLDQLLPRTDQFLHCTPIPIMEWNNFRAMITNALLNDLENYKADDQMNYQLHPCLRHIQKKESNLFLTISQVVFQNKKC